MKHAIAIACTIMLSKMLYGQTVQWDSNGLPIRQGVHIEWQKTVCPGGDGSSILFWSDTRNGNRDIFAQKVSFSGDLFWGENGIAITNLPGRQEDPVAIEDGNGGAFVAWVDYRFDEQGDIFMQHIDSQGNTLMDSLGIALCQVSGRQISINMCTDSSGGVFVTWQDGRNGLDEDIYGTHVDNDNFVQHEGSGTAIIEALGTQGPKSIEYAGDGDALVVWSDARISTENLDIYAQRINQNMEKHFDSDGLAIANSTDLETRPKTTFMSGVKSCVVWQQGTGITEVVYQVVDTSGLLLSVDESLTKDPASKAGPRVKRGLGGTVFASWEDYRYDSIDPDYYIQRISVNGSIMWDSAGIPIDSTFQAQSGARFTGDPSGGVVVVWERGAFPNQDIITQHFDLYGNRLLADSGLVISNADGNQTDPIISSGGAVGQFIIFADAGSGSIDLQSQLINELGQIGFEENGINVMEGMDGDVKFVRNATLLDGSTLLSWEDNRYGKVLFGTHVSGNEPDPTMENGIQVGYMPFSSSELINEPTMVISNESIYTGVFENSSGSTLGRINRLNLALENEWDSSGVYFYQGTADQRQLFLLPNPSGVACVWSEIRNANDYDIYFRIMNGDGSISANEIIVADEIEIDEYVEAIVQNTNGEYMIFWQEDVFRSGVFKYVLLDSSGSTADGWNSSGLTLTTIGDPENLSTEILPDSSGALLVWEAEVSGNAQDLFLQVVDWEGNKLLGSDAINLTNAVNDQSNPSIGMGSESSTLISWSDFRNGESYSIYGQRFDITNLELADSNFLICCEQDTFYRDNSDAIVVGENSFFVVWEDERGSAVDDPLLSGGLDLYGAMVHQSTVAEPIILAAEYHDQKLPQLIPIGNSDDRTWLLHWQDLRSSGKEDLVNLYGQVLHFELMEIGSPDIPNEFSIGHAYPNPFNGNVSIPINAISDQPIHIAIHNILGQQVYQATLIPNLAGAMSFNWAATDMLGNPISSGVYLFQIESNQKILNGKFSYVK